MSRNESAFEQFAGGFDHFGRGQPVVLIEMLGDVRRLAELAANAKGLHSMRDAGEREGMGDLRAHSADDLMILDGDDAAGTALHRTADSLKINVIDKGVVDDCGVLGSALRARLAVAWGCLAFMAGCRLGMTAPGFRPGGRVTFFCWLKRKSPKKRAHHMVGALLWRERL